MLLIVLATGFATSETHPKAAEINAFLAQNPNSARLPKLLGAISANSMDFNKKGFNEYAAGRYAEALDLFQEAIEEDQDNIFSWFNAACTNALMHGDADTTLSFLVETVERDWYWGVKLMVDSDLDSLRYIPGKLMEGQYLTFTGPEYSATYIHKFHADGTVDIIEDPSSTDASGLPANHKLKVVGTGFYCLIGDSRNLYVFQFFPDVNASDMWYRPFGWNMENDENWNNREYDVFTFRAPYAWYAFAGPNASSADSKSLTFQIGDTGPAGGIIFYDKGNFSDGWRYLEAAPSSTEETRIEWGFEGKRIDGADGTEIGTGLQNTADVLALLGIGSRSGLNPPARICAELSYGGYKDWFLPSLDELTLIYENLFLSGKGDFKESLYWSSSEYDSIHAWSKDFRKEGSGVTRKDISLRVRAIRYARSHAARTDEPSSAEGANAGSDADASFALVEAGSFTMGSPEDEAGRYFEEKQHTVVLTLSFEMSKWEVTHAQFIDFLNDIGVDSNGKYQNVELVKMDPEYCGIGYQDGNFYFKGTNSVDEETAPVMNITWYGAVEYCNWLSGKEGLEACYTGSGGNTQCNFEANGYRLPTEAEWEYAARGGNKSRNFVYAGSNIKDSVAWYRETSYANIRPVGQKQANELGIFDMSGNIAEWCWDWYGSYPTEKTTDPRGRSRGSDRVFRGGAWHDMARDCRNASRNYYEPWKGYNFIGFRFVRTAGVE